MPVPSIDECIVQNLNQYFKDLNGQQPYAVYDMVLAQVEKSLFRCVLAQCNNNQSQAAKVLGLNRNTLRKKMCQYNMLDQ